MKDFFKNKFTLFFLLVILSSKTYIVLAQEDEHPMTRKADFTYQAVINNIPENRDSIYIWLPLPSSNEYQEIKNLKVKSLFPYKETEESKYGNRILFVDASNCKDANIKIEVRFDLTRKEHHTNIHAIKDKQKDNILKEDEFEKFLKPSRLAIVDENIKSLASLITKGKEDSLQKVKAIYDYLIQKMEYNKEVPGWGQGDSNRAITVCKGNCSDFHSAFLSLTRAVNIPSKFQYGFVLPESPEKKAIAHCWAEFYIHGYGWIPVDISEADKHPELREYYFGNHDKNRVLFSIGRDIKLNPKHSGEALNFFIKPYVEIDDKSHHDVNLFANYSEMS